MDAGVPLNRLVSVATDGAPSMIGKNVGLMWLSTNDSKYPDILKKASWRLISIFGTTFCY